MKRIGVLALSRVCLAAGFALAGTSGAAAQDAPAGAQLPPTLFSARLADVPGKQLVVVELTLPPMGGLEPSAGHRHPGSVFVYVTEGTARLGLEGQPVQEVPAGKTFFEPPGVVHTVAESASTTTPAKAIAVMIVPDGAPIVLPP